MRKIYLLLTSFIVLSMSIQAQLLTDSLIVYYDFQGNGNDLSGNNLNATVTGPTLTADRKSNANNAYSFDGTDDVITFSTSSKMKPALPISVSFWIKSDKTNAVNPVFGNNYQNNKYNGVNMNIGADGAVSISFGDGNGAGSGNRQSKVSNLKLTSGIMLLV